MWELLARSPSEDSTKAALDDDSADDDAADDDDDDEERKGNKRGEKKPLGRNSSDWLANIAGCHCSDDGGTKSSAHSQLARQSRRAATAHRLARIIRCSVPFPSVLVCSVLFAHRSSCWRLLLSRNPIFYRIPHWSDPRTAHEEELGRVEVY